MGGCTEVETGDGLRWRSEGTRIQLWIELMKEIHTFIAQQREHPEEKMIYVVLDELTSLLKILGIP